MEADGHTFAGGDQQVVLAGGEADPGQFIALVEVDGDEAGLPDVAVVSQRRPLDDAVFRDHAEESILIDGSIFVGLETDHTGDLLVGLQL